MIVSINNIQIGQIQNKIELLEYKKSCLECHLTLMWRGQDYLLTYFPINPNRLA